ncbi:MAG: LysM peptidoglycan-binding domain-containing protein [Steroidobacteraceae bacterium]|nr:LysM peptidoglycan-binding domain-containing protein [Steroidobacteraceae bacterium]
MSHRILATAALALLGLSLAGCATTGEYSSLPPSPRHPPGGAPATPTTVVIPSPQLPGAEKLAPAEFGDLLDRIRVGYGLPQAQHYAVEREIDWYRSRPDFLDRTFRRGARYLHYIVTEIERRDMPLELALLPVVESAFNPVAYSRSRASGLWQFIPSTGKHYGLDQNWWIDERRDVLLATDAALTYLKYLHNYFNGDWYLAIAAYNGGEGTVSRAVKRNAEAGRPTDFFSLDLKAETRDYVPKLLAISRIVANPAAYGLQFEPIPNQPYFGIVDAGKQVHLGEAADLAGISRDDMFALNPAFNRMTTPPSGPHRLLLPVARVEPFRLALMSEDGGQRVAAAASEPPPDTRHRVKRGDNLTSISRQYGVPVATLKQANNLRGTTIHPGDTLVIPGVPGASTEPAAAAATVAEARPDLTAQLPERQPAAAPSKPRVYTVKRGDTLWGVAQKHGVTVPALASANGLSAKSHLTAGARLEIPGSDRAAPPGESTRMTYKVRSGDTLSEIAEKFNVSVRQLMTWNQLRTSTSLRAGQRIVVYVDPRRVNGG